VARVAVFTYILGFASDLNINALLILLVCCSAAAAWLSFDEARHPLRSPIVYLVALFLVVAGLSILLSEDVGRSLRLSAPLIPAVLLFFLIYEYFEDARDLRHLYACLTIVALGLAVVLLWTVLGAPGWHTRSLIQEVGSPILIVPHDVAFLAVIAPLSLALIYLQPRSAIATLALVSMALSLCVATVYLSRTATLTFLASTLCTAAVLRAGSYVFVVLIGVFLTAGIDYLNGHALVTKFLSGGFHPGSGRLDLWAAAWAMFLDAPLFGHGLHTYGNGAGIPWTHNLYLQTLAEQGIVGLLALLLLLSFSIIAACKTARFPVREQRILAAGALGALVGFCAASVVELTLLREWVVVVMFVVLAVVARVQSEKTPPMARGGENLWG
jgi:O-antigen ligase